MRKWLPVEAENPPECSCPDHAPEAWCLLHHRHLFECACIRRGLPGYDYIESNGKLYASEKLVPAANREALPDVALGMPEGCCGDGGKRRG